MVPNRYNFRDGLTVWPGAGMFGFGILWCSLANRRRRRIRLSQFFTCRCFWRSFVFYSIRKEMYGIWINHPWASCSRLRLGRLATVKKKKGLGHLVSAARVSPLFATRLITSIKRCCEATKFGKAHRFLNTITSAWELGTGIANTVCGVCVMLHAVSRETC